MTKKIIFLLLVLMVFSTSKVFADLGVGVGVGKIQVDQQLKQGQIYNLPAITVLNTGDQPSDYRVLIEHQEKQPQLIPEESWFIFSPKTFHLEPKRVQTVRITLNLPVKTVPGEYFAYLEAQPVKKIGNGQTSVNIAAATKLYFTVVPGSLIEGIYYKALSLWSAFAPIPQIIAGIIILIFLFFLGKRFIKLEIKMSKKSERN
ncbi:MAG TPA: hypothetical protein VG917_01715 [Patescibacteria group bacterium]|nr:hypothetical protein [Patescibacteria group bacterium]